MSVVVVGSCNLDLIVEVPALPAPGQTVLGKDVLIRPGGKGANQAVAAARLDADVTFVGAVGTDHFGTSLRGLMHESGLDLSHVATLDGPSGVALIVVDELAENVIAVSPGANHRLLTSEIAALDGLLGPQSVLLTQFEIPLATCLEVAAMTRRAGGQVVVNCAPMPDPADATIARLLQCTDVLVANQVEALALSAAAGADPGVDGWEALARRLRRLGPRTVIVTLGADGAAVADGDSTATVPSLAVHAVDSTGAGDAFCGALAASLATGLPMFTAVRRACLAGALTTTAVGAQEALPRAADLAAVEQPVVHDA